MKETFCRLALADGTVFWGNGFGAAQDAVGEVVFNTGMSGYQEIMTDPSYRGQLVVMTAPQIGNTGWNEEDMESERPYASGMIVRDLCEVPSNWRSQGSLSSALAAAGVPGISGVDTRILTRILRDHGSLPAVISRASVDLVADEVLVARAQAWGSMEGRDLVREVSCDAPYEWNAGSVLLPGQKRREPIASGRVVVYDFGVKRTILRCLCDLGFTVTVVPATTPAKVALAPSHKGEVPCGVVLSNGPGDPAALPYAIETTRELLATGIPIFGICLGHQILGLALSGRTYKLKFGHHGINHPVLDLRTGQIEITSQNHGFAVDVDSISSGAQLTHTNLNDNTVEGLCLPSRPVFSLQYHPEAAPGPLDAAPAFARFAKMVLGDLQGA